MVVIHKGGRFLWHKAHSSILVEARVLFEIVVSVENIRHPWTPNPYLCETSFVYLKICEIWLKVDSSGHLGLRGLPWSWIFFDLVLEPLGVRLGGRQRLGVELLLFQTAHEPRCYARCTVGSPGRACPYTAGLSLPGSDSCPGCKVFCCDDST